MRKCHTAVDETVGEIGEVFATIAEIWTRKGQTKPPTDPVEAAARLTRASKEFMTNLDARTARGFLEELDSSLAIGGAGQVMTTTVTVTVTVTITVKGQAGVLEQLVQPGIGIRSEVGE